MGGRVHQETLPNGNLVDLGPNWIHGTDDNPILDIAKKTNTAAGDWHCNTWVYDHLGEQLPLEDGEKYSAMVMNIVQEAFEHSNAHGSETHVDRSLLDFVHERVLHMIPEDDPDCRTKREMVTRMAETWGAFVGSAVSRQSLKYFWLEECLEGGIDPWLHSVTRTQKLTPC